MSCIATLVSLPHTVPADGVALPRVDGRLLGPDAAQGVGPLEGAQWQGQGVVDAILFPATRLRLRFAVTDLRSTEGVRLDLTVTLVLHIADPLRFVIDVVREQLPFDEPALETFLADLVRGGLGPAVAALSLAELAADADLRGWLGEAVRQSLQDADLGSRSGLTVEGLDAFDMACAVWNEVQNVRERLYLERTLAGVAAQGQRLLDETLLAELRQHAPIRADLADYQAQMQAATSPTAAPHAGTAAQPAAPTPILSQLRRPPSILRPEVWRQTLDGEIACAPLYQALPSGQNQVSGRVYVATRRGAVHAFDAESGRSLWSTPAQLPAAPGDGMAVTADALWVPGQNGILYAVDVHTGSLRRPVTLGGRLSSAPLAVGDRLYLSIDVDAAHLETLGQVVMIDARNGKILHRWQVSRRGVRAAPALMGNTLYVGDRQSGFYAIDVHRDHVQSIPVRGGRILAAAAVDEARKQVIVGTLYGVVAIGADGETRWTANLGHAVVGRPCLAGDRLYVGAADGQLHTLDPSTGTAIAASFAARGPIAAAPVMWGHLLFVSSIDGYLYAIDTRDGRKFWEYHSGSAITVPPALTRNGRLFVADSAGHVSALRWCLHNYADGARLAGEKQHWEEACELWTLAGDLDEALQAAQAAKSVERMAEIAATLQFFDRAAGWYSDLARRHAKSTRAALYWRQAAQQWTLAHVEARAQECLLQAARSAAQPLLDVSAANLPTLTLHQAVQMQVRVRNLADARAANVVLTYSGHVQHAARLELGSLDAQAEREINIEVTPSQSGSALVELRVTYSDGQQRPLPAAQASVRLSVTQPPQVNNHYHGPVINGEGVIILRGEGRGRHIVVQDEDERIELGRDRRCPRCGEKIAAGARHCDGCGAAI